MIAWMLYAVVVGVLIGSAAFLAERSLRLFGRPARLIWVLAMCVSVAVPVFTPLLTKPAPAVPTTTDPILVSGGAPVWQMPAEAIEAVGAATVNLDSVLVVAWIVVSLGLLAWMVWSWIGIRREREGWVAETVDGHGVYVSSDVGPAVIDPIAGGIVVPRWLCDAPAAERGIALRHELEHVLASDHRLLWGALLLCVAFPWNLALWWQLRRLKHATELDCDRRVLAGGISPADYAELLLHVVTAGRSRGVQPALTEQPSFLRWRIRAMIEQRIRYRIARSFVYGAVAAGLTFLACETQLPEAPYDEAIATRPMDVALVQGEPVYDRTSVGVEAPEAVSCPVPRFPQALQGAGFGGQVTLQFVVLRNGSVDAGSIEVVSTSFRVMEDPAREMMARCRFRAGRLNGEPINALVEISVLYNAHAWLPLREPGTTGIRLRPIRVNSSAETTTDTVLVILDPPRPEPTPPVRPMAPVVVTADAPATTGTGTVRGTVYDPPGAPLPGAQVLIFRATPSNADTAFTNDQGAYVIENVPVGSYTMLAQFRGYRAAVMAGIRILAGDTLTADFRLAEIPERP